MFRRVAAKASVGPLVLATWGLGAQMACADGLPGAIPLEVQLSSGTVAYRAAEYASTGQLLNQESGQLHTAVAGLRFQLGKERFQVGIEQSQSPVDYDGQTQTGIALATQTSIHLRRVGVDWLHQLGENSGTTWFGVLGIERMQLDRLIKATLPAPPLLPIGTQPLRETMDVWVAHVGMHIRKRPSPESRWRLEAAVALRPTLHSRLKVDTFGTLDPVQLSPGKTVDWRLGLQARYSVTPSVDLHVDFRRDSFTPRQSAVAAGYKNGVPSASVRYPGSRQYMTLLFFGATWHI